MFTNQLCISSNTKFLFAYFQGYFKFRRHDTQPDNTRRDDFRHNHYRHEDFLHVDVLHKDFKYITEGNSA